MTAYPWGGTTPSASDNIADHGAYADKALEFTDDGAPPGAAEHHYAALVAANQDPASGTAADTGGALPRAPRAGRQRVREQRRHVGAERLRRRAVRPRHRRRAAVRGHRAGGREPDAVGRGRRLGPGRGRRALRARRRAAGPRRASSARSWPRASTSRSGRRSRCPATRCCSRRSTGASRTSPTSPRPPPNLQIRWTNQGEQFPAPLGTVAHARWFGAGFPDYPWIFATDGEYTAFAALALGQFETAEDHLRALRDISDVLNDRSGIVVHETVSDGSVYFGHDSRTTKPDGSMANDFNTDETIKFPSIVALIWRWTGDNGFRDEMYDFAKRNLQAVDQRLDVDHDGWPEGSGNVERPGMGPEKLDNAAYYIRALADLADMARSRHDGRTFAWAKNLARKLQGQFEGTWWDASASQYADSLLDPGNQQVFQKHWIGQVPMEDELTADGDQAQPGLASYDHGTAALAARETACFSGDRPGSRGLFHTGCGGGDDGKGDFEIFSLDHGHPGRRRGQLRAPGRRPAAALHRRQRGDDVLRARHRRHPGRAAGGDAGDLPVGAQRRPVQGIPPNLDALLDLPLDGHAGVGQLRHRLAGDPPAARRAPVPERRRGAGGAAGAAGPAQRRGHEHPPRRRRRWTCRPRARATPTPPRWTRRTRRAACSWSGTRCRAGRTPSAVTLDGSPLKHYTATLTNRGLEVSAATRPGAQHTLTVTA